MRDGFSALCFCNNFSLEVSEPPLEWMVEVTFFWTSLIFCRKWYTAFCHVMQRRGAAENTPTAVQITTPLKFLIPCACQMNSSQVNACNVCLALGNVTSSFYVKKPKQSARQPGSRTKFSFHVMFQFVRNYFNKLKRGAVVTFNFFALDSSRQKLYLRFF